MVLDDVADPVGTAAPTVDRAFFGRARDILRRIAAEDKLCDAAIARLIEPARDRLRRYPNRNLRPEMLARLFQGWCFMDCRDWRLSLDAKLDKGRASLVEHRLVAGVM
jgi:hypothetical protein